MYPWQPIESDISFDENDKMRKRKVHFYIVYCILKCSDDNLAIKRCLN